MKPARLITGATYVRAVLTVTVALGTGAASDLLAQTPPSDSALRAFEVVRSVFQHPRCQNCHIPGDAPLQYDQGRTHAQNVMRGPRGHGVVAMECAACHHDENLPASYGDHAPPGAPNWHLPPPETKMVFIGLSFAKGSRMAARLEARTLPRCWRMSETTSSSPGDGRPADSAPCRLRRARIRLPLSIRG